MKLKLALASIALAATLSAAPASATTYGGFGGGFGGFSGGFGGFGGGFGGFGNWGSTWNNWGGGGSCGIILRFIGNCGGGGGWHTGGGGGGWNPGGGEGEPSPVPLPAALPLLVGGLAVAGAISTRRKKAKSI